MSYEPLEGWYTDPFERHEARWFSAGAPSKLVRDGGAESSDPPPDEPFRHPPTRVDESQPDNGDDLLRADSAEGDTFDNQKAVTTAFMTFDAYGSH